MRQVVYIGDETFRIQGYAPAPPGPGQVQIDVAYTGICGTDLHIKHGVMDARVTRPAVIGHEMSGRVASAGPGVEGWSAGDPVTVMPLAWCGDCPACTNGHTHICHRLNFIGIDSAGSLQQRWIVPASALVRLPAGLALDHAALVEPTAVAVHDVRRGAVRPGETVVVVGGGPVGQLIALVARRAGADVLLVEPDAYRRGVADGFGLRTVAPADAPGYVTDWTGGAGAAVAFEVSGAAAGVGTAVDVLAVRGRLVLVAIHGQPREVNLHRFFWRELTLIGARLYDRSDFEEAVALVAAGDIPAAALISRVVPLDGVADAFTALEGGGVMKVLVACEA
ncbi:(R,R)-butanediol dehydrogenase [Catenuloplanes japonicus]|uniref:(R,R)-butanediol dehydrogenase n=1 Tax=Catenuloplanes japonicus TaxID=33876 RepID=UPI000525EA4C|nr:(R,R)-butanediol dehydrogenase [Catenuloplanes japonicus]